MQSNNPVFRNSDEFNGRAPTPTATRCTTEAAPPTRATAPVRPVHLEHRHARPTPEPSTGPMTIDSVVQKTGLSSCSCSWSRRSRPG